MSWSVGAAGKAPEVQKQIATQFETSSKCVEPEESVRLAAMAAIDAALAAQHPATTVKVSAWGSQSTNYTTKAVTNSLSITVEPIAES